MADESRLYLRVAEVVALQKVVGQGSTSIPPDAARYRNRVNFQITKTLESDPNTSRITIYNLNSTSRGFLEQANRAVFLRAGYRSKFDLSDKMETIFFGDVKSLFNNRFGPDIVTTLECGDSEGEIINSIVTVGFGPGVTNKQILAAVTSQLQLNVAFVETLPNDVYANGFTYSGQAKLLLNDLVKKFGFEWSAQNGELQITKKSEDTGQEAVFLSPQTGLIGYPTKTEKGIRAVSLLNTKIRPGRAVVIQSEVTSGKTDIGPSAQSASADLQKFTYKVTRADFIGDTEGGPWNTQFEGEIPNLGN